MSGRTSERNALVLAPHPDDETIGCGGTIRRKTLAGAEVTVVIAADGGDAIRRAETVEACRRLGVPAERVRFLGFPDGDLGTDTPALRAALQNLFLEVRPVEVFIPSGIDNHPDHRALAASVDAAALDSASVYDYPVWFWNRWAWADWAAPKWRQRLQLLWRPLRFTISTRVVKVDIRDVVADKRSALSAHVTQVGGGSSSSNGQVLDPTWLETFFADDEVFFRHRPAPVRQG